MKCKICGQEGCEHDFFIPAKQKNETISGEMAKDNRYVHTYRKKGE